MALRKSPEERAAKAAAKTEQKRQNELATEERRREQAFKRAWTSFWASPAGQARQAFAGGDQVFQSSFDVMDQQAIIVAMIGSTTSKRQADPTVVLNSVCHEGWELVNGDFVFVMRGQQSRDKLLSSGQNVAIAGTTMGYYLFRRCEPNQRAETDEQLRIRLWRPILGAGEGQADGSAAVLASLGMSAEESESENAGDREYVSSAGASNGRDHREAAGDPR